MSEKIVAAAQKRIEITDGVVFLKDFIDRKTMKAFRQKSYGDSVGGADGKVSLKLADFEEARDALVLAMVEKVEINGKAVIADEAFIDGLRGGDFDKIANECQAMIDGNEELKKK